jgi:DNA recombination protein RmuC
MSILVAVILILLGFLLVLSFLHLKRLSQFPRKETDLVPIVNSILVIEKGQDKLDRSLRDELARNRQEESIQSQALRGEVVTALVGIGGAVSTNVENLTRSNDQKLELVRSAIEQRLESFTSESGRKVDCLNQAVATSAQKLHDEVSSKLNEFKTSLEGTVRATHQLEREQTESISSAISSLQSKVEETRAVELRYMSGALLVASIVAAIRLRGDEIKPSP